MKLVAAPVKQLALEHGLAVATPATLSVKKGGAAAEQAHEQLRAARADVLVVAAYGLILPQAVLDIPAGVGYGLTALNIHASLLPRWRGAAPVARAIEAGDGVTGVTLMEMDAGLDTGPMLRQEIVRIAATDTTGSLTQTLAQWGARMLVDALQHPAELAAVAQPEVGITYAHKLDKAEAWLDFREPAEVLARRVRAFDPFPVATAQKGDMVVRVWAAEADDAPSPAAPGTVLAADGSGVQVATGRGVLRVTELQRAGGKRLAAKAFLAGTPLTVGDRFEPRRRA
jgi:methionyl-tRNA formyltransferase